MNISTHVSRYALLKKSSMNLGPLMISRITPIGLKLYSRIELIDLQFFIEPYIDLKASGYEKDAKKMVKYLYRELN
jgi:hypothetical protein